MHVGIQTTREQTTHTKPQLETPRRSASPAGQTSLWRDRNWSAIQWNVKSCKKVTPSAATPCFARTHHSLYRHRTFFGCDLSLDSSNLILFVPSRARLNKRKCTMRRINLRPASAKAVSDYICGSALILGRCLSLATALTTMSIMTIHKRLQDLCPLPARVGWLQAVDHTARLTKNLVGCLARIQTA